MQVIILIILIIAIVLLYTGFEEMDKKLKHTIVGVFTTAVIIGGIYNYFTDKSALSNRELVNHFHQGKTLVCKDYEVNNKKFGYENGTESFVAKKEQKELVGVIVPLFTCKDIKE